MKKDEIKTLKNETNELMKNISNVKLNEKVITCFYVNRFPLLF